MAANAFVAGKCLAAGACYDPKKSGLAACVPCPESTTMARLSAPRVGMGILAPPTSVRSGPAPQTFGSSFPTFDPIPLGGGGNGNGILGTIREGVDIVRDVIDIFSGDTPVPGSGGGPVPGGSGILPTATKCPEGTFRGPAGTCLDLVPGGAVSGGGMVLSTGEAVMGRYGAALVPQQRSLTVARCPRGAVLGNDGLCYNKASLRQSDRKWVPGRKPLLTGGDLNAIARASRAAGKMKTQQKRLQKLGLLAKPKPRQARLPAHHHHVRSHEDG